MAKRKNFPLYPDDWLGGTMTMTAAERGVYIDLLCASWSKGGPLTYEEALAAGRQESEIVRSVLDKKFHRNPDGTLQNNRLEQERKQKPAKARKKAPRIDSGELLPIDGLKGLETGLTLYRPAEPPLLVFPCRGEPSNWGLTAEQVEKWKQLYPGLDVLAECRKALAWVEANGSKTAGGMTRFLVKWLNRATNSSGSSKPRPEPKTFRQVDADAKRRMLVKLKLEAAGLNPRDAERLSNLDEASALQEATRLMKSQTAVITQEEIPW
jgi:hypothetical protein